MIYANKIVPQRCYVIFLIQTAEQKERSKSSDAKAPCTNFFLGNINKFII